MKKIFSSGDEKNKMYLSIDTEKKTAHMYGMGKASNRTDDPDLKYWLPIDEQGNVMFSPEGMSGIKSPISGGIEYGPKDGENFEKALIFNGWKED